MKISDARFLLRQAASNAGDSTACTDFALDLAIQAIGDDFAGRCDVTAIVTQVSISEDDEDWPDMPAAFREEKFRYAWIDGDNVVLDCEETPRLAVWSIEDLLRERRSSTGDTPSRPKVIAFEDATTIRIWPPADDDYDGFMRWVPPFTSWHAGVALASCTVSAGAVNGITLVSGGYGYSATPAISFSELTFTAATATATISANRITALTLTGGGSGYATPTVLVNGYDATDQTLNIPEEYLREALLFGGVATLQFTDLKRRYATPQWQRYLDHVERVATKIDGGASKKMKLRGRPGWGWVGRRRRGGL